MKLYKYCESKFNPLHGCNTIRIGTTEYFRKNYKGEEDMIGDPREGISSYKDQNSNYFINYKTAPNTYIYCLSTERVNQDVIKQDFDSNYESHYTVTDWRKFAGVLAALLEMNFTLDDIDLTRTKADLSKLSISELKQFSFNIIGDKISYLSAKSFGPFRTLDEKIRATIFSKTDKYAPQMEFRIAFLLHHPLFGYLPVKEEPKTLDTRLLSYHLSSEAPPMGNIDFQNNIFINGKL